MNQTTAINFVRMHLDEGKPPESVFHAFRNCFPEDVAGIKRADLEKMATAEHEKREFLQSSAAGQRYYELICRRSTFMQDVLEWIESHVEELSSTDPGTDVTSIEKVFAQVQRLVSMMTELDRAGEQTGAILRELSSDMPKRLQVKAAELFPNDVPLR